MSVSLSRPKRLLRWNDCFKGESGTEERRRVSTARCFGAYDDLGQLRHMQKTRIEYSLWVVRNRLQ